MNFHFSQNRLPSIGFLEMGPSPAADIGRYPFSAAGASAVFMRAAGVLSPLRDRGSTPPLVNRMENFMAVHLL